MKILSFDQCIRIGTFLKQQGFSGTLQLVFEPEWELSVKYADILFTETDGTLVPWFVAEEGIRITSPKSALVDLDWINTGAASKKLVGCPVFIEKDKTRTNAAEENPSGLIGMCLYEESGQLIGEITNEEDYSGNIVVTIQTRNGEKLIPLHPDLIIGSDPEQNRLIVKLPDGILDL